MTKELEDAQHKFELADRYYDGAQRLEQMGLAIPEHLMKFTVIANWCQIAVDAIHERLKRKGFRFPGQESGDDELWRLWTANQMQTKARLGDLDALIFSRSYNCVGTNEKNPNLPLITTESPREMITERNPRTGAVSAAAKVYEVVNGQPTRGTLYLPHTTIWLTRDDGQWQEDARDDHGLGVVPVVPKFNRRRLTVPSHRTLQGQSQMEPVIPLVDSAARSLTNAQVAQETHAVPQRGVMGAAKGDFVDANGKPLPVWEAYFGAVWALQNKDAKTFQFDASEMSNFERMINLYARLASGVSAVPAAYFGLAADDAASADAIRSRESRTNKVSELKQEDFGESDAETLRIALLFRDRRVGSDADRIETLWYDPATPTKAQHADAVVKLVQAKILPIKGAWEELGYGAEKMRRYAQFMREQSADPTLEQIARDLNSDAAGSQ
ncbi:hypothetical protein B1813_18960 [Saccharomonospora piscinae]|uniref:Phage portal protein n=1 Tax=Saccharomonospora piscinae TaxID=687388 RepID=A0A1V8ZZF1_SACPI|nr:hypothetical protein B1813_18960 [Saccharomonospora piscinae]